MKAETYMTSKEANIEYGFQLTSDDGDFIMDMVLGEIQEIDWSVRKDIENQFEKHRPLITMMAEAPNLLAALENLLERDLIKDKQNDHYQEVLGAIAKARGENQ